MPARPQFDAGTAFGGRTFAWYSIVCFLVAFLLPVIAKYTSRKMVHALALAAGGVSLMSAGFIHDRLLIGNALMIGVGIAWASILSMPFAILSGSRCPPAAWGFTWESSTSSSSSPRSLAALALGPVVKLYLFVNDPVKVIDAGRRLTDRGGGDGAVGAGQSVGKFDRLRMGRRSPDRPVWSGFNRVASCQPGATLRSHATRQPFHFFVYFACFAVKFPRQ